jgi:tetratricopeptide (TPR) repeat protein
VKKTGVLLIVLVVLGCGRDADYYMEQGNAYLRRGDMAGAIGMFERAVEIDPDNHEAHNSLGASLSAIGDYNRAIGHFRAAVAVNDSFVEGHYNLGRALAEIGSYEEALAELAKTIQLDSTYALAHLAAGDVFTARKMRDQAVVSYEKAIVFDPNLIPAYIRLSSAYAGGGDYERAIELLLEARERKPRNPEVLSMAGRVAIMKRDFDQAAQLLEEAVRLDSTDLFSRNDLATALMLSGREDQAVSQWRSILRENPDRNLEQTVRENLKRAQSDTTG